MKTAFHRAVYSLLRFFGGPVFRFMLRYTPEICTYEGPCIVMANHATNYDPFLLACAFPKQMYFVASEHIFRWGWKSKAIRVLVDPISRLKGTTAGDTALAMLRRVKAGNNVAIFAEGSCSFNGLPNPILPSTGKLAKLSGAALITYRLEGGFFSAPRWGKKGRRPGKMSGRIMNIYTPETLRSMTAKEVHSAIVADLYEDAYASQRRNMTAYKGKGRAESLETVLCICPRCGGLDTLRSEDERFECSCGYKLRYNEYGFFEGEGLVYDSVTDWDKAQTGQLLAMADRAGEGPIFGDEDMELYEIGSDYSSKLLAKGSMSLYRDRLECCGRVFPLSGISGFDIHGRQAASMNFDEHNYEILSPQTRCTRKYMSVIHHLQSQTV